MYSEVPKIENGITKECWVFGCLGVDHWVTLLLPVECMYNVHNPRLIPIDSIATTYTPIGECQGKLGRNPQKKSFFQSTMFRYLSRRVNWTDQDFSLSSLFISNSKRISTFSPFPLHWHWCSIHSEEFNKYLDRCGVQSEKFKTKWRTSEFHLFLSNIIFNYQTYFLLNIFTKSMFAFSCFVSLNIFK